MHIVLLWVLVDKKQNLSWSAEIKENIIKLVWEVERWNWERVEYNMKKIINQYPINKIIVTNTYMVE